MSRLPLATTISSLLVASMLITPTVAFAAGGVVSAAERERSRRMEYERRGEQSIENGDRAMKIRDYEKATAFYKAACDIIPNAALTGAAYHRALEGFCDASCKLAEQRITEGRYADAENTLRIVTDDRYNPRCKEAIIILAHLEDPAYYNRTITPQHRGNVERVKQLFTEAQGYYDSGRLDYAFKRCEQILSIDKYNKAARAMEEKIDRAKSDFHVTGYNETRARGIAAVDAAWANPVRKFNVDQSAQVVVEPIKEVGNIARIQRKLERIIIPKLEFKEATIREAVDYLKKKSLELDPDEPKTGVNIVLKLESGPSVAVPEPPAAPAPGGIPGLDAGAAPAAPLGSPGGAPITVSLSNIPMIEALKYVTNLANLKFKVEPFAVSIVPLSANTEVVITREWKVRPDLIPRGPAAAPAPGGAPFGGGGIGGGAGGGDATRGGTGIADRESAKNFFIANGVQFNGTASAIYIASTSRLIVRNTQDQLDLIDQIINSGTNPVQKQVEIEAKFVEISQNNLKELSFDWLLGQFNAPATKNVFLGGGTSGGTTTANPANDFPFVQPGNIPVGTFPITGGNRSGTLALSASAVDALLFGSPAARAAAPALGAIAGVFTDPQFQLVIRALNQRKGVDLLSSPRVTTKSGQRAVIEIIREFKYPTEFQAPTLPPPGNNNGGLLGQQQASIATPTTPTAFEVRNTGVTLEVEPTIGPDDYTITLSLVPQVVEFEGFINYGSPILSTQTDLLGRSTTSVITPNTINQPVFSTRKVTTVVDCYDGNTVVLGGLMREDVQKVEDKTPILGDLPIVGRLFRSSVDQHTKRNLVIFVSARLMKPDGDPVRMDEEKEEVIETLAPPDLGAFETSLPLFQK